MSLYDTVIVVANNLPFVWGFLSGVVAMTAVSLLIQRSMKEAYDRLGRIEATMIAMSTRSDELCENNVEQLLANKPPSEMESIETEDHDE